MDGKLPFAQRISIWLHLLMCRHCIRFRNQLVFLRKACRVLQPAGNPSSSSPCLSRKARESIKRALDEKANNFEIEG